jgi:hypothetical protein
MPEKPTEPDKAVGPWKLPPETEASRLRGLRRGVGIVLTLFQVGFVFMVVLVLWSLWRIGVVHF